MTTTLDKRVGVSVALALEFEGAAITHGMEAEEFLRYLLDTWSRKRRYANRRRNRSTDELRAFIREQCAKGKTDTWIAEEAGVSQQAVSRLRAEMGIPSNYRNRGAASGKSVLDYESEGSHERRGV